MSGRQTKVLNAQAELHGIPFGGPVIDLAAVVKALHNFLAANKFKLAADDDPMLGGANSPALERFRVARAIGEEFKNARDLGQWIRRDNVHQGLAVFAGIIRNAGDALQRQHGNDAHEILDDALTDAISEIERRFPEESEPPATKGAPVT